MYECGNEIACFPIHYACMRQPPLQIIAALIAVDPTILEEPDGLGRLALHASITYGATHQVCC